MFLKYKSFIIEIASVLICILVIVLVIYPQFQAFITDRDKLIETKQKTQVLVKKEQDLKNIDQSQIDKDLEVVFTILPLKPAVPESIITLQGMADQSGLILSSINYSSAGKSSAKDTFKLNATTLGQISAIDNFLTKLKDSPRLFQVESISATTSNGNDEAEAEIPILAQYKSPSNSPVTVEQPLPTLNERDKKLLEQLTQIVSQSPISTVTDSDTTSVPLGKTNLFE